MCKYRKIASIPGQHFGGYFYKDSGVEQDSNIHKGTQNDSVGPGHYFQESTFSDMIKRTFNESSFFMSNTKRGLPLRVGGSPGPGQYNP